MDTQTAIDAAAFAKKQAQRAEELVPKPDPRNTPWLDDFVTAARRAAVVVNPRRNRWPELEEIDARINGLGRRQGEARAP